jgi:hypothetical protein
MKVTTGTNTTITLTIFDADNDTATVYTNFVPTSIPGASLTPTGSRRYSKSGVSVEFQFTFSPLTADPVTIRYDVNYIQVSDKVCYGRLMKSYPHI